MWNSKRCTIICVMTKLVARCLSFNVSMHWEARRSEFGRRLMASIRFAARLVTRIFKRIKCIENKMELNRRKQEFNN